MRDARMPKAGLLGGTIATLLLTAGCSALATAMWVTGAYKNQAEFPIEKEKKVAVVARPMVTLTYRDAHVDKDLARRVRAILVRELPKVQFIDQQKVERWLDENSWENYSDVGKALGADYVIGVEIEEFGLYKGQTVYQGTASLLVQAFECANGNRVYEKRLNNIQYPPNGVVPTSEVLEPDFRREFVTVLAEFAARPFHAWDPNEDVALDARSLNR